MQQWGQREWENATETALQMPRLVKKEGEEKFPCSLWWRLWWCRLFPCSPQKTAAKETSTSSCGGPTLEQTEMTWRELQPAVRVPHGIKVSYRNWGPWRTHTAAVHSWRTHLAERTHSGAVVGEWHPWKGPCWRSSWRAALCGRKLMPE